MGVIDTFLAMLASTVFGLWSPWSFRGFWNNCLEIRKKVIAGELRPTKIIGLFAFQMGLGNVALQTH